MPARNRAGIPCILNMKKTKSKNKKSVKFTKKTIIICAVCVAVICALLLVAFLTRGRFGKADEVTTSADTAFKSEPVDDSFASVTLGSGLRLIGLAEVSANYPEDGSDAYTEKVLSATIVNEGTKMLQYAVVEVYISGEKFTFDISSIPVGEKVMAFENNKKSAPEKIEKISCKTNNVVFFDDAPSKLEDKLSISFSDGMISIKNLTDEDIKGSISIYYKNKLDDAYYGGITYRINLSEIGAGKTIKGASSHADAEDSVLMFIQYVQ